MIRVASSDDITTSWLGSIPVGQVVIAVVFMGGVVWWMWRTGRKLRNLTKPIGDFLHDWAGEPARPGVDARPGVMLRLAVIESQTRDAPTRSEFNTLARQVDANTAIVELVKPLVRLDLPGSDD